MEYTSLREFAELHNLALVLWFGRSPNRRVRERLFNQGYLVYAQLWPLQALEPCDDEGGMELRTDIVIEAARLSGVQHVVDGFGMTDEQRAALDHSRLVVLT